MNAECLRNCSSIELLTTQKRIAEILKTRHGRSRHCSNISSRSPSVCSGKSRCSRKSINYDCTLTKSHTKRSQSLIHLEDRSSSSSCVDSINKKYQQLYNESDARPTGENSDDDEENIAAEKSISMSTSVSNITYSKAQESQTRSKQYQKLSNAVKRLYSMIEDVHTSCRSPYSRYRSQLPSPVSSNLQKKQLPRFFEKDSITTLARLADRLAKDLQQEVSNFIVTRRKEKNRLGEFENDNSILKQRLNNSLTIQRNLEGELQALSKEKMLLETENKNLAIKIAPLLNDNNNNNQGNKIFIKSEPVAASRKRSLVTKNGNSTAMHDDDFTKCHSSTQGQHSRSPYHCSRQSSMNAGLNTHFWYSTQNDNNEHDTFAVSQSMSDSNLTVDSTTEDNISRSDEVMAKNYGEEEKRRRAKSREELDSIASYVRWKTQDFNRLHGRLHKSFEELQQLKETMSWMSQEKSEILTDLQDLVDSYRELERERDNYESILKMILKEKNSSESNIRELLDGLLVHLSNTPVQNSFLNHQCEHDRYSSSHKSFLESALHVIQEQNISIREEMARLRESLQNTTGQNTLLQENNKTLTEKVNDLQRQVEITAVEAGNREKEHVEKFEHLDKLYKTILTAKDDLENRLQEREREIVALNLKTVTDASEKASKEQAEKIAQLKEANEKLEREVGRFKASNEKLNLMIRQFKADVKDQKGKYSAQLQFTNSELQKSKEQCNWLQGQLENFKTQLQDAHERIKLQEKDKSILAHKVLTAEEERKTLDRNIQEIRTIMEADKLYQQALFDRNEVLQLEVNRLRTEKQCGDSRQDTSTQCEKVCSVTKNIPDRDGSGEKKNNNNSVVNTAVKTVKSKPLKSATPNSSNGARQLVSPMSNRKAHHKCAACESPTAAKVTPIQRTAAAKRLSNALSNNSRSKYQPRVKAAASSGRQDSTQTPPAKEQRRAVVSSHTIRKDSPNTLLCTSGNRPMVALVRVKNGSLIND